jgi:hypothetical protein
MTVQSLHLLVFAGLFYHHDFALGVEGSPLFYAALAFTAFVCQPVPIIWLHHSSCPLGIILQETACLESKNRVNRRLPRQRFCCWLSPLKDFHERHLHSHVQLKQKNRPVYIHFSARRR